MLGRDAWIYSDFPDQLNFVSNHENETETQEINSEQSQADLKLIHNK